MKQVAAAVDFGTSKIACLIGENRLYGRFDIIGAGVHQYAGFRRGAFLEPMELEDAIYTAIRTAELESRKRVREVFINVPGECLRVVVSKATVRVASRDGKVAQSDVANLLRQAAEYYKPDKYMVIARSATTFFCDDQKRSSNPVGMRASVLSGLISYVTADSQYLDKLGSVLSNLGLSIAGIYSSMHTQALSYIPQQQRDKVCVIVDCGYYSTEIAIVQGDGLIYTDTIPVGGFHISSDISYGFDIEIEEAELIKRKYGFGFLNAQMIPDMAIEYHKNIRRYSMERLQRFLEPRIDEIIDFITESVLTSGFRLGPQTCVYLTGGGFTLMRGIRQYISGGIGRQVHLITPYAAKYNQPMYSSAISMLEYAFKTDGDKDYTRPAGALRVSLR